MVLRRRNSSHNKRHRTHKKISRVTIGFWLIALGFLLIAFPTAFKALTSVPYPQTPAPETVITTLPSTQQTLGPIQIDKLLLGASEPSQQPLRIVIPSLSVDLPVVEAPVINGYWELSETSASHGVGSANPGDPGNTVIFAHAREELFGPLRSSKKENLVYILTKDHWYRYRITNIQMVDPKATEVIQPTKDETLTLYTCSGFLDSKRLIVTAKPLRP